MSIGWLHPELLLLALPALWLWWRWRTGAWLVRALRLALALLLVLALAGPTLRTAAPGRDLVLLVDRSLSMPAETDATALELARLAGDERRAGDRLALVDFAGGARLVQPLSESELPGQLGEPARPGATDLATALDFALALLAGTRPARILLVSDGESSGRDPLLAARRAGARGIPIDVRLLRRPRAPELSVERIELPIEVAAGEPFHFHAWVRSDRALEAGYRLLRDGETIAAGRRSFAAGLTRIAFRDFPRYAGIALYELAIDAEADPYPENDRARAALAVRGARRILLVNDAGAEDSLVRALRQAGIAVDVAAPESAPLERSSLAGYRAVILANVAAGRLGRGLVALREHVLERGGGLLMTGGRASFGLGGYHRSAIDELLPVGMEMQSERRRQGIALAIVMDRSGSMAMPAGAGVTKMELANRGAAEAIALLSPLDSVAVIAVDTQPHVVLPLMDAEEAGERVDQVLRIAPQGGGIFVRTGLVAAARELADARQLNKHVILFADAADSEEQQGCPELVRELRAANVTLSTIALGTPADTDAEFLRQITELGEGGLYFSSDPADLPRLFALDTLTVARASFSELPATGRLLPPLLGLGEFVASTPPTAGGYNLCVAREGASLAIVAEDEHDSPLFAYAQRGLGRCAALTAEVGGEFGAPFVAWDDYAAFAVTLARWLAGQEEPLEVFASVRRVGAEALLEVELDPGASVDLARLEASFRMGDGSLVRPRLERSGASSFEARIALEAEGVALGTLSLGDGRVLALPPIALPYSPEYERGLDPERGARLLREIARESGGSVDPSAASLYSGSRRARAWRSISRELLLVALALFLIEIAVRRLHLPLRLPRLVAPALLAKLMRRLALPRARSQRTSTAAGDPRAGDDEPAAEARDRATVEPAHEEAASLDSALERARRAAQRRLRG